MGSTPTAPMDRRGCGETPWNLKRIWDDETEQWIPVRPGHIAILMRANEGFATFVRPCNNGGCQRSA